MAFPPLIEVFGIDYTHRGHVALLLLLFTVCITQLVISIAEGDRIARPDGVLSLKTLCAAGISFPLVGSLCLLIRMYIKPLKWFYYSIFSTLTIEMAVSLLPFSLKAAEIILLFFDVWMINTSSWSQSWTLLIACSVLELVLVVFYDVRMLITIIEFKTGARAEINRMLREVRGRSDGTGFVAGVGLVPNGHLPN